MHISRRHFVRLAGLGVAAQTLIRTSAVHAAGPDLAHDPLRPACHLLPPHNWMNDPNGPIWWKGSYHLFYQLNPHAAVWGDMHWGHAVSADMVRWRHQPIALAPTPGSPDSEGCFTGSAIVADGVPTFIYTGVQNAPREQATIRDSHPLRETQMLATAEDDRLLHWKKQLAPVIAAPPPGLQVSGFRDPCPWRETDGWYLGIGSGESGKGGCVLLYRSQDLRHWEYLHKLTECMPADGQPAGPCATGDMWECPDFFPLGDCHCLYYSAEGKVVWTTGRYDAHAHRYTPARNGLLDYGAYYAAKGFLAPDGRRIVWGWIQETRPQSEFSAAGWAGVMSLPRVLGVDAEGSLTIAPAAEVNTLRGPRLQPAMRTNDSWRWPLSALRCELNLRTRHATAVRLRARGAVVWELAVDPIHATVTCGERSFSLNAAEREPALRIFLDGSVLETFIGSGAALTSRVYNMVPGATELEVETRTVAAEPVVFALQPISPDRLTR